jgi:hypothetical protein
MKNSRWLAAAVFAASSATAAPPPPSPTPVPTPAPSPAQSGLPLQGRLALWERTVCDETRCQLPEPSGVFWNIDTTLRAPSGADAPGVTRTYVENGPWSVSLTFFWVKPGQAGSGSPGLAPAEYLVTQTALRHETMGLLAECTRYDRPEQVSPFPVGACSGAREDRQFGVSLLRTEPRPKTPALPTPQSLSPAR